MALPSESQGDLLAAGKGFFLRHGWWQSGCQRAPCQQGWLHLWQPPPCLPQCPSWEMPPAIPPVAWCRETHALNQRQSDPPGFALWGSFPSLAGARCLQRDRGCPRSHSHSWCLPPTGFPPWSNRWQPVIKNKQKNAQRHREPGDVSRLREAAIGFSHFSVIILAAQDFSPAPVLLPSLRPHQCHHYSAQSGTHGNQSSFRVSW